VVCNSAIPLSGVSVVLKDTKKAEQKNTATNEKGEFVFHLKQQSTYLMYGKKENYFSQTETILTSDFDRNSTLFIKLEICMEEADCEKALALKNILYDFGGSTLRPESKKELDRLVQFMVDNPDIRVELQSHTDSRASHSFNEKLSQDRANSAVEYVISQGVRRDRLVGKGYGETKLLNECADGVQCSEEKHQLNRRTEMRVICPR
jgi:outer membrane protein OmpA-like peptidoglycan-associated protein